MAEQAVRLRPGGAQTNTLGVARYRAGDMVGAIEELKKSEALDPGRLLALNGFFLAMAHLHLGQKVEARVWFDKADAWMEKHHPNDQELVRFRAEAGDQLRLQNANTMMPNGAAAFAR